MFLVRGRRGWQTLSVEQRTVSYNQSSYQNQEISIGEIYYSFTQTSPAVLLIPCFAPQSGLGLHIQFVVMSPVPFNLEELLNLALSFVTIAFLKSTAFFCAMSLILGLCDVSSRFKSECIFSKHTTKVIMCHWLTLWGLFTLIISGAVCRASPFCKGTAFLCN